ncbi:hypothetical protein E1211_04330 [Micromonospora sp. 15K316]|uniref:DUF5708 family protein n=1 Tax=Micromonospora sp. 15K316 TaxID=2530376 RepID=UPI00105003A6|nr:DUF5708 family protein [Micromonospora sp. 15K316]TDC39398.1 hypothetical protein E1211_04330 [Micromonospora sp. 15K316]
MAAARKTLVTGLVTFVLGLALRLFGSDEHVLVFTPSKLGVVLMVVGGLEAGYGLYRSLRGDDAARG